MSGLSAIEILEEAIHLLREQTAAAWLIYLAGAAPFLLATLYFAVDMTSGYMSSRCLPESLLCAALFVWMNLCKARFAGRLLSHLAAETPSRWTFATGLRCLALQAPVQAAKLVILPVALLIIIPFAWTVAFFRNATVMAAQGDARGDSNIVRAARYAALWQRQNWQTLAILSLFSLAVFVNVAITLIVLPQLFKSFTGYENEFTRGMGRLLNFSLFAFAAGLTWLILDPVVQAVYVVRCFYADARQSGADLLVTLRKMALLGAIAAAIGATGASDARADQPQIAAHDLDRSIAQVLQQDQYAWRDRLSHAPDEKAPNGIIGRMAHDIRRAMRKLSAWIDAAGAWLRELFRRQEDQAPEPRSAAPAATLRWSMYVLLALIAAAAVFFVARPWSRRATPQENAAAPSRINLADEKLLATELPEDAWLALARESIERGDFRLALRALYLANLAFLGRHELLTIAAAKSNREYERELRRRLRDETVSGWFTENVRQFERAWYGMHDVTSGEVERFEENFAGMRHHAEP